jgi:hypothetical protein
MISTEVRLSRFPVGSSASSIDGWFTSARDGDTLLLPPGHLRRKVLRAVSQTHHRQRLGSTFLTLSFVDLCVQGRQFRILQRRRARQEIKPLENKPELLIPNQCQRSFVMLGNIDPFEQILSGAGTIQAPEYVHEGGFAASARAHDGQEFPALNLQTHSTQGVHTCFAQFVILVHVFHPYDRARRSCRGPSFDLVGRWHRFRGIVSRC